MQERERERGEATDAMGKGATVLLWWVVLVIMWCAVGGVLGHLEGGGEERQESEGGEHELFLMRDSKQMVKTDAGEMRVVRSAAGRSIVEKPMHIGFIIMEPKSLFVPQYLDSSLILFIRRGIVHLSPTPSLYPCIGSLAYFDDHK